MRVVLVIAAWCVGVGIALCAPFGSTTSSAAGGAHLHTWSVLGATFSLPPSWVEAPQPHGTLGDHEDYLFTDPADTDIQLLLIADNCSGCITKGVGAYLVGGVHFVKSVSAREGTFQTNNVARDLSTYYGPGGGGFLHDKATLPPSSETKGIILLGPRHIWPASLVAAVSVPKDENGLASRILASVRISHS